MSKAKSLYDTGFDSLSPPPNYNVLLAITYKTAIASNASNNRDICKEYKFV